MASEDTTLAVVEEPAMTEEEKIEARRAKINKKEANTKIREVKKTLEAHTILVQPVLEYVRKQVKEHKLQKVGSPKKRAAKTVRKSVDVPALIESMKSKAMHRQHQKVIKLPVESLLQVLQYLAPTVFHPAAVRGLATYGCASASKQQVSATLEFLTSVWRESSVTSWQTLFDFAEYCKAEYEKVGGQRHMHLPIPPSWERDGHYIVQSSDDVSATVLHRLTNITVTIQWESYDFDSPGQIFDQFSEQHAYFQCTSSDKTIVIYEIFRVALRKQYIAMRSNVAIDGEPRKKARVAVQRLAISDGAMPELNGGGAASSAEAAYVAPVPPVVPDLDFDADAANPLDEEPGGDASEEDSSESLIAVPIDGGNLDSDQD
eukprot:CAMPEP_0178413748 /NCGR_PEP_ID=MMETSP0689_2-20121128/22686_1 /TAXON_ID=160604 /ORGANISM="Amphidinium massartii, Strain CS-259" /LENGTH=374 /DNA_ID=CAMNT_0020035027 /DNA_START=72 /DNA_END=1196 /DNA_ORIENTATION=+